MVLPVTQLDQFQLCSWHHFGEQGFSFQYYSPLLNLLRWGKEGARETVRLTVGRDTTKQMVDRAVDAFAAALMC